MIFNGCSITQYYIPEDLKIKQGVCLNKQEIKKIHLGMTQSEILNKIGSPTIIDFLGSNTWYYICCYYYDSNESKCRTVAIKFNSENTVSSIKEYF